MLATSKEALQRYLPTLLRVHFAAREEGSRALRQRDLEGQIALGAMLYADPSFRGRTKARTSLKALRPSVYRLCAKLHVPTNTWGSLATALSGVLRTLDWAFRHQHETVLVSEKIDGYRTKKSVPVKDVIDRWQVDHTYGWAAVRRAAALEGQDELSSTISRLLRRYSPAEIRAVLEGLSTAAVDLFDSVAAAPEAPATETPSAEAPAAEAPATEVK